ncbi:MAG: hypothetical protein NTZ09_12585 [Candidatus Hydrogenedentes bacterium]|nr:hypothetical protein [Candidatus Hydrogenedentota bacterium]
MKTKLAALLVFSLLALSCQTGVPAKALQLGPESLAVRQLQSRVFDTSDEMSLLSACSGLMQDLGFNLEESETKLGVLVGSKERSAVNAGQVAGKIVVAVLLGANLAVDKNQVMRASVVTKPVGESKERVCVRVTFQRVVYNEQGAISKRQPIDDPQVYQEFFEKLSKAVFLEAQQI